MTRLSPLFLGAVFPALLLCAGCARDDLGYEYLDNGVLRVGISKTWGGAVGYLAESGRPERNYINRHDSGRLVQYSYYGLPRSNDGVYPDWPWNPVAGGDGHGNPSRILSISNDGTTIVVRTNPLDWSGDGRRTGTVFETRYTLEGRAVRMQNTLYNDAQDHHSGGPGFDQEIPALYVTTDLETLTYYGGNAPFTGGNLSRAEPGPPPAGMRLQATECWAAYVNADGFGVGVCVPGVTLIGNAFRSGGQGVAEDDAPDTNYFAFCGNFNITPHLVRTDTAYLVLGTLDDIRGLAAEKRGETAPLPRKGIAKDDAPPWENPPWRDGPVQGESVVFVEREAGLPPAADLLFRPESPVELWSPTTGEVFEEGRDFTVDARRRQLAWMEGSRVPHTPLGAVFPPRGQGALPHRNGRNDLYCAAWRPFHDMQLAVSYAHSGDRWEDLSGYVPAPAEETLPRTLGRLRAGAAVHVVVLGDSISVGADASGWWGDIPPCQPPYPEMLADGLRAAYGADVRLTNLSVGGTTAAWGVEQAGRVAKLAPDLAIVAFGMNDQAAGVSPGEYGEHLRSILDSVSAASPGTEFILVASMPSSPEWENTSLSRFSAYAREVRALQGAGRAAADLTTIWTALLARKPFFSLTGNGVNHPNDFGHRIQAQALLGVLGVSLDLGD